MKQRDVEVLAFAVFSRSVLIGVDCITDHAKFRIVCLDTDVLNTALVAIRYPVNSPTCKLAYANSPTPSGELAYVGEFDQRHRRVRCL